METGSNLQNRAVDPKEPRGSAEAQAAMKSVRGDRPEGGKPDESPAALAALRERIARARAVAPPSGDNQFAQGCFNRGRDAALAIIDGDVPS